MSLHIKNMFCDHCIMVVKQQIETLGFPVEEITQDSVSVLPIPDYDQLSKISSALKVLGFELIESEKDKIVSRIQKRDCIKNTSQRPHRYHLSFSSLLADNLNKDSAY